MNNNLIKLNFKLCRDKENFETLLAPYKSYQKMKRNFSYQLTNNFPFL